ncbi:LysR family transcriptional regulator [Aestuariispira insulae]|uniref:DNA-binding transcriptional LysR family regulator n=1 Tax=Aestuariispira insulae TaxID=1461337 RepID=A0A3D9H2Q3_9PROT|nr:LysR family transcriptional regulator [Aestuariispira insulae]RED43765.1 DNA-binding transcriptional LysR family regulator [Aestuariispira insulae]
MDKLSGIRAFVRVVDEGGFAAAARQLGLSRSQINRAVINLEEEMGVQLLHRTTRKVSPTATGEKFYDRCTFILSDLEEAEKEAMDVQANPKGIMRINAPMTFGTMHLGPAIADFMVAYPEIRISLTLSDRFVDPMEDGFDMTVRITQRQELAALVDHEVIETRRVICASPAFLEKYGMPETSADLRDLPCLHYGTLAKGASWKLRGPDGEKNIAVNGVLCSNNAEILRDAALKDLGITLLPTFTIGPALRDGRLVQILDDYKAPPIFLTLLYPPNRYHSAKLKLLIDFLYDRFGENPVWEQTRRQ